MITAIELWPMIKDKLEATPGLDFKKDGPGRWRSNSPIRIGKPSNSHCFQITEPSDQGPGGYFDHVSKDKGSLFDLAPQIGIELPKSDDDSKYQAIYNYYDEAGNLVYQVCKKYKLPNGQKRDHPYLQRHRCPEKSGEWVYSAGGNPKHCGCPKIQPSLYRLPELLKAQPGDVVILTEGEKDADTARRIGFTYATSASGGGGKFKKIGGRVSHFDGLNVVILPDQDKTGEDDTRDKLEALGSRPASIKVINLPGLVAGSGQDLTDWIENVGSKEALDNLIATTKPYKGYRDSADFRAEASQLNGNGHKPADDTILALPVAPPVRLSTGADILAAKFDDPVWTIPDLLPAGLTFIAGKPKLGKSWLALQIGLSVTAGGRFFGRKIKPGKVLFLALEDNHRRLQQRMWSQGWHPDEAANCTFMVMREFRQIIGDPLNGGIERLGEMIKAEGYTLTVIDTVSRFFSLSGKVRDQNKGQEMTNALTPLQELAMDNEWALILIDHHNKAAGANPDAIDDIGGAIQKAGIADTAWGIYRERGKTETKLQITGRDVEEITLAIKFDRLSSAWQCEGDYYALKVTEQRQAIIDYMTLVDGGVANKDVARELSIASSNASRQLGEMVAAGLLVKSGEGKNVVYTLNPKSKDLGRFMDSNDNYDSVDSVDSNDSDL